MKLLVLAFLTAPTLLFAQENEHGRISKDTLFLKNGARFIVGEKLKLAYGSGINKTFEFVFVSPTSFVGPVKLQSSWANHDLPIKGFKFEGNKKTGKNFYIVLASGNISPYWCDIVAAMDNGEVVVPGITDKKNATAGAAASTNSPADELKKLKELYDNGALTKAEYDSAKKKVLAKM